MADVLLQLWEKQSFIWIEAEGTNQSIGDGDDWLFPFLLAQKLSCKSSVMAAAGMVESSPGPLAFCRAPQLLIKLLQLKKREQMAKRLSGLSLSLALWLQDYFLYLFICWIERNMSWQ